MVYDWILYIIMGVVGLVILNTMLMSVVERNHEIGVIKALGFNNLDSFLMIVMEALYLGCIGSVGGGIIGSVLSIMVEKHGINFSKMLGPGMLEKIDMPIPFLGSIIYPDYQINFMLGAMAFGLIATLLAVLYPACKSSRMLPVEAFRSRLNV
jgi:putative ABC transport system permease protein